MHIVWIILAAAAVLAALWCWAIAPGKQKAGELIPFRRSFYAHRGLHDPDLGIAENSLTAFRRAAQLGYGAELDVRLTKDGRLAISHDDSLLRVCGVDKKISESTAAELSAIRLGGTEDTVPFLEQVLPLFAGKAPLIVELKPERGRVAELCAAVCALLRDYPGQYCVESFWPQAMVWMKHHAPALIRGQLCADMNRDTHRLPAAANFGFRNLLTNCAVRPDFVAYRVEERNNFSFRLCKRLFGVQEVAWTVRSEEQALRLHRQGVLVIFESCLPQTDGKET